LTGWRTMEVIRATGHLFDDEAGDGFDRTGLALA
jgi:hypothetical protein